MYDEVRSPRTGLTAWRASSRGPATVLPDAEADLMWWREGLWIAGIDTTPHTFHGPDDTTAHGVRFPAGTIAAVLRDSAATVVDRRVELREVMDRSVVARLAATVARADDTRAALAAVAARVLDDAPTDAGTIGASQALLAASARALPVEEVARMLGWSPRRLHRFALDSFGVSPVTLRRLLRFRRARRLLAHGLPPVEVAGVAGYSDQAHLTREVVRLAGLTPARLHVPTV